jgi:hypothetical protein
VADEVVRIGALGQEGELHAVARLQVRQRRLDGPEGGPAAGSIAVEDDRICFDIDYTDDLQTLTGTVSAEVWSG